MATPQWSTCCDCCHCSASAALRSRPHAAREQNTSSSSAHVCVTVGLRCRDVRLLDPPVRPGPLVERGGASGAVLAAQAGRTRHVVVGNHRRLHRLQGLIGSVASGQGVWRHSQHLVTQTGAKAKRDPRVWFHLLLQSICPILPQGAAAGHGGAGRLLRGRVCPGNGPPSSCCVVAMLLEEQSAV